MVTADGTAFDLKNYQSKKEVRVTSACRLGTWEDNSCYYINSAIQQFSAVQQQQESHQIIEFQEKRVSDMWVRRNSDIFCLSVSTDAGIAPGFVFSCTRISPSVFVVMVGLFVTFRWKLIVRMIEENANLLSNLQKNKKPSSLNPYSIPFLTLEIAGWNRFLG